MKRFLMRYGIFFALLGIVLTSCAPLPAQPPRGMMVSSWSPATITYLSNNTTTSLVDLGANHQYLNVYVPTITAGTVQVWASDSYSGTYAADNLTGASLTSSTGGYYTTLTIGGYQYIKIVTGAEQAANRTFLVRGYTP